MKKLLFVFTVLLAGISINNTAFGQESVKNRVGFFLASASGDVDQIGLGGIGEFRVGNKITISPQLIFYFPEERGPVDVSFFEINGNVNYYFYNHDVFEFYGLGGLNVTRVRVEDDNGNSASDSEVGINIGGGINFEVGRNFVPFSEVRITIGEFDQFVISAGLKFNIGN